MKCVILAGGVNERPLESSYQPGYKATFPIGDRPCLSYVLDAISQATSIDEIAVVAPAEVLDEAADPELRETLIQADSGKTYFESLKVALGVFPDERSVLIATGDLPLLKPYMVERFLRDCEKRTPKRGDHLLLSVVRKEHFIGAFTQFAKNFNRFRGQTLSHGNLALVTPTLLDNKQAMSRVNEIYSARTSPVAAAMALGPKLGLGYVLGVHMAPLLSLRQFSKMLSRHFHIEMRAIDCPYPEVALDLDEESDLVLIRKRLGLAG